MQIFVQKKMRAMPLVPKTGHTQETKNPPLYGRTGEFSI